MLKDSLPEILRVQRAKRRLKLREIHDAAGMTPALVSALERGEGDPRLSSVERLLKFYGLELTVAGDSQQT